MLPEDPLPDPVVDDPVLLLENPLPKVDPELPPKLDELLPKLLLEPLLVPPVMFPPALLAPGMLLLDMVCCSSMGS